MLRARNVNRSVLFHEPPHARQMIPALVRRSRRGLETQLRGRRYLVLARSLVPGCFSVHFSRARSENVAIAFVRLHKLAQWINQSSVCPRARYRRHRKFPVPVTLGRFPILFVRRCRSIPVHIVRFEVFEHVFVFGCVSNPFP